VRIQSLDVLLKGIREAAPLRHHLAHGYTVIFPLGRRGKKSSRPNLHIMEHEELVKRLRENLEAHRKDSSRVFWAEDLHPLYTIEDLNSHIANAETITAKFQEVMAEIKPWPKLPSATRD
jgi:hypothetical protein